VNLWDKIKTTTDVAALPSVAFTDRERLPAASAVYFAVSGAGDILYIGKAHHVRHKWRFHHRLEPLIALACARIHWFACPIDDLVAVEDALNARFDPPLRRRRTTPPLRPQRDRLDPDRLCRNLAAIGQQVYGLPYEVSLAELRAGNESTMPGGALLASIREFVESQRGV
jgi:hypothetical protein